MYGLFCHVNYSSGMLSLILNVKTTFRIPKLNLRFLVLLPVTDSVVEKLTRLLAGYFPGSALAESSCLSQSLLFCLLVANFPFFSIKVDSTVWKISRTRPILCSNLVFLSAQLRHIILDKQLSTLNSLSTILSKLLQATVFIPWLKSFLRLLESVISSPHCMQNFPLEFCEISTLVKLFVGVVHSPFIVNIRKSRMNKTKQCMDLSEIDMVNAHYVIIIRYKIIN